MKNHGPLLGLLWGLALFALAATFYPGGTVASPGSAGYDWTGHTISALFQPLASNGEQNPARPWAVAAVLLYCLSMALVFAGIARQASTTFHQKTIRIAGIGAMVYAALAVTPMHNLMVTVALAFFVVAVSTILHSLHRDRRTGLFAVGLACVSLPLVNAALYYGDVFGGMLPGVQKAGTVLCAAWLLAVFYRPSLATRPGD